MLLVYWLLRLRRQPRQLLMVLAVAVAITLPISLIGSPPLLAQWFANITQPNGENLDVWTSNNLSLSTRYGVAFAVPLVIVTFGGLYWWLRRRWEADYSISLSLTASMLLAPYASNQSAIVPIGLHPSWRITGLQYLVTFSAVALNAYARVDDWMVLSLVILSITFAARSARPSIPVETIEGSLE